MCQRNVKIRQFVTTITTKTRPRSLNTELLGIFPHLPPKHHSKLRPFSSNLNPLGGQNIPAIVKAGAYHSAPTNNTKVQNAEAS
ncbi:Efflux pump bik6 [Fusarium oxysporum f. sp. albedinis]|nr:Efflux pump bik6 [Fusarium oxysporum f. sp. albedinis]